MIVVETLLIKNYFAVEVGCNEHTMQICICPTFFCAGLQSVRFADSALDLMHAVDIARVDLICERGGD